eukprot:GHVU01209790.1.p1 GENE.GHVU01209790.1~~GHVU01209790.1.p1  ORF type:complete len:139 (+),score=16.53 GHVU01209790.1:217-633(+)
MKYAEDPSIVQEASKVSLPSTAITKEKYFINPNPVLQQGSYVALPRMAIGKEIRVDPVEPQIHEGKREDLLFYAAVTLHFWRDEKLHEVTLKMKEPNKDNFFDKEAVLEELKSEQILEARGPRRPQSHRLASAPFAFF